MDNQRKRGKNILWLLVLLMVLAAWWFLRGRDDEGASKAQVDADRAAAVGVDADEILVNLKDDVTDADVASIDRDLGIHLQLVSHESLDERFYRAHVDPARRDAILAKLSARSDVEIAEPDATVKLSPGEEAYKVAEPAPNWEGFPNDPLYTKQWHMRQIKMPAAWKLADGDGVTVAVIDTGVAFEDYGKMHEVPDLKGVEFVHPYNFVADNTHAGDDHGHGTHVAGTIAQVTNNGIGVAGIARKVKIMPLKVLAANGSGSVAAIADAIRYAADNGAQVINMSLGGRFPSRIMKKAVAYAHSKGVTVVCAAGNDGSSKVGYPAAYPGAIAVAATQNDESTTFYSNYGKDIDIAAPGGNTRDGQDGGVLQNTIAIGDPTQDGYYAFMGTSMASPHVAGVAALVVGEGVTNPNAVERILLNSARSPEGHKLVRDRYGAGILDAEAAVLEARSQAGTWELLIGLLIAGAVASRPAPPQPARRQARRRLPGRRPVRRQRPVLPALPQRDRGFSARRGDADPRYAQLGSVDSRTGRPWQRAVLQRADSAGAALGAIRCSPPACAARRCGSGCGRSPFVPRGRPLDRHSLGAEHLRDGSGLAGAQRRALRRNRPPGPAPLPRVVASRLPGQKSDPGLATVTGFVPIEGRGPWSFGPEESEACARGNRSSSAWRWSLDAELRCTRRPPPIANCRLTPQSMRWR